jgi:DnaJ-class molecular chaperone
MKVYVDCPKCKGKGACPVCGGFGELHTDEVELNGATPQECDACGGSGECSECRGIGIVPNGSQAEEPPPKL